ncbi:hypothetical protein [Chryseobacterium sp. SL1]|uniref:hypothetical protein n=1 Tax=Chryseobacterium sp. SL1 TaxID=2995159 RepID=UPI002275F1F5|nr:hypothetical protein [Chryseobacterium sp. SL1]MCY1659324.1 hypothetical protein [Chryseobacterium sp. SL1]
MKNKFLLIAVLFVLAIILSGNYYFGYQIVYQQHKDEENGRAKDIIKNKEIPNYNTVVGTLDFIINDKSGEL